MQPPRIDVTDSAKARIAEVRANRKQPDAAVRIAITGRTVGEFVYDIQLVSLGDEQPGDLIVAGPSDISFLVPMAGAPYLDGITVDVDPLGGAIQIINPNPLWHDDLAAHVQRFIDEEINPMVASHGGHIDLLDVSEGVAYVHMGGGCQGCGMASVTLSQGVRSAVLDRFPGITDVRDTTDHAQGANPYYQAAKK